MPRRASSPLLAPSRRHVVRSHSDSYSPIYSPSSSANSSDASVSPLASSASSATTSSGNAPSPRRRRATTHAVPTLAVPLPRTPTSGPTQVVLPRTLARPHPQPVSPAALVAAGPDLAGVPLPYILRALEQISPRMMAALARTTAPVPPALPHTLDVHIAPDPDPDPDPGPDPLPTHLLAVYARTNAQAAPRRRVTLFPTHAIVLAAHCAHLPPLPGMPRGPAAQTLTLPVVPLCIPAPAMFPVLQAYLYTKRVDHLLAALVPAPAPAPDVCTTPASPPSSPSSSPPASPSIPTSTTSVPTSTSTTSAPPRPSPLVPDAQSLAASLAQQLARPALVRAALRTHGLWADAAALGVFDTRLWQTIDFAWRVLLGALECAQQCGQGEREGEGV